MNPTVKVVCGGMGLKMMVLRSPTAKKKGQDAREGWERTGKDSNINPPKNVSWACSVLRPHLWCWDYLPKGKGRKVFRTGTSRLAPALLYLHQSQGPAPAPPPPKHSDEEKGPKARDTGRHNTEKVQRHRQNSPCALSPNFRLPCQEKHSYLLLLFCCLSQFL